MTLKFRIKGRKRGKTLPEDPGSGLLPDDPDGFEPQRQFLIELELGFDRLPPSGARAILEMGPIEADLVPLDTRHWLALVNAPHPEEDVAVRIEHGGDSSATLLSWSTREVEPDEEVPTNGPNDGKGDSPSKSWVGPYLPSKVYQRALNGVIATDPSDPSLSRRAALFLTLDLASYEASLAPNHPCAPAVLDTRKKLELLISNPTPVLPKDYGIAMQLLAKTLERAAREGELPNSPPGVTKVPAQLKKLLETLVCQRLQRGAGKELTKRDGEALIGDFVRFASGRHSVDLDPHLSLFNCAPNGIYYTLFPTLALLILQESQGTPSAQVDGDLWLWLLRATLAGLEAFAETYRTDQSKRNFNRFITTRGKEAAEPRIWHRERVASAVSRVKALDEPQLQRLYLLMTGDMLGEATSQEFKVAFGLTRR